jgi:hypothetical protein
MVFVKRLPDHSSIFSAEALTTLLALDPPSSLRLTDS